MNISAVLAIICFVAVHRNKSTDLSSFFIKEKNLKEAFDTLISYSALLAAFAGTVIFSLWNMELLTEANSVYVTFECSIVIVLCWLISGGLLLHKA